MSFIFLLLGVFSLFSVIGCGNTSFKSSNSHEDKSHLPASADYKTGKHLDSKSSPKITKEAAQSANFGNGNGFSKAECLEYSSGDQGVFDLRKWQARQILAPYRDAPAAHWNVAGDGKSVTQETNAAATIYLSSIESSNTQITGHWRTNGQDDDMMGFVFGYQNDQKFYLFDWKHKDQAGASQGMAIKVMNKSTNILRDEFWLDRRSRELFRNRIPWERNKTYTFDLIFKPGDIQIKISDSATVLAEIKLKDSTFTSGKFGFYNFSQDNIVYEGFRHIPTDCLKWGQGEVDQ